MIRRCFIFTREMRGNFLYKRLGDNVIRTRRLKSISQELLAELSGIDRTYLARIEQGKANPTIKILHKIAFKLQVELNELFK